MKYVCVHVCMHKHMHACTHKTMIFNLLLISWWLSYSATISGTEMENGNLIIIYEK